MWYVNDTDMRTKCNTQIQRTGANCKDQDQDFR